MTPTEELKKALLKQKIGDVPENTIDLIARLLEVDRETVARVAYTVGVLRTIDVYDSDISDAITPELCCAIDIAARREGIRFNLAKRIRSASTMAMDVNLLLPPGKPENICNGCNERIECMAGELSTPERCRTSRHGFVTVFPVKMTATHLTVEAAQPSGTYEIPLKLIKPDF